MEGRTIIIGDVHGCIRELDILLERLNLRGADNLLFVGDLINKGPASGLVVQRARELGARSLLGNHEARILQHLDTDGDSKLKKDERKTLEMLSNDDLSFLRSFPLTIQLPEYQAVTVHGGFLPQPHWSEQPEEVVTRIQVIDRYGRPRKRDSASHARPWADFWNGPETVIYGHTPRRAVFRRPFSVGIDTGCVYGGRLTAFIFPHRVICQVKALEHYAHP